MQRHQVAGDEAAVGLIEVAVELGAVVYDVHGAGGSAVVGGCGYCDLDAAVAVEDVGYSVS